MTRLYVDGPTLIRAVRAATRNLERHVEEVDSLNVFPVPDGDTGSNMLATMRAALAEAEKLPEEQRSLDTVAEALSRGALTGARGNSGVILSQIIRGMTHGADGRIRASGVDFAAGLRKGSEVAYESVLTPVEGTILTVIRDAADAAESAAGRQPHVEAVLTDVIEAAASSVQRTPTLLPVLEDAGVVDSGGQGLYRVLEGMLQVEGGSARRIRLRRIERRADGTVADRSRPGERSAVAVSETAAARADHDHGTTSHADHDHGTTSHADHDHGTTSHADHDHGAHAYAAAHGYETQYLLSSPAGGIDVEALRAAIQAVGDSVVVAGDDRLVRVHVHGDRPDLAIAAGLRWGRLVNVEIIDLDEQVAQEQVAQQPAPAEPETSQPAQAGPVASTGPVAPTGPVASAGSLGHRSPPTAASEAPARAIVAVTTADGLAQVFESLGARVVRPRHGMRPSVGEIAEGILAAGASEAIVLPNDRDAILAASQADGLTPMVTVRVIPTRNAAEGIAAAVAFDPDATLEESVERMGEEARALRSFRVITAAKDSVVDGTAVHEGQVLALDAARHLLASGDDVEAVTLKALATFDDFELITLYCGRSEGPGQSLALCEHIELAGFGAEVEVVDGGQPHDHLLVSVE